MSLRIVLLLAALAIFVAGNSLLYHSDTIAEWTDTDKANAIQTWDPPDELQGPAFNAYHKRWVKAMNAVRTEKWPYHDAGAALIAFAVCLTGGLLLLRVRTMADFAALTTPRRAWAIYALGLLGWFVYWASAVLALLDGFNRFEFPPWADTLIIPIIAIACFAAIGSVVIGGVAFFILRKAQLPAPLWIWRKDMPAHDWLYTIGAAVSILIALEVLRETYLFGHWLAIPAMALWIYATLATRAAGISKGT